MSTQKNPPCLQAKIKPSVLREAVQKVFAYDPSSKRKRAVGPPAAKHRSPTQKKE